MLSRVPQFNWPVTERKLIAICYVTEGQKPGRYQTDIPQAYFLLYHYKIILLAVVSTATLVKGGDNMAWIYLFIAGLFEVVWAIGLKYSHGFTRLVPSIITIFGMIISFYLLAMATRSLPIGTSYAVWTGIGALGTVIFGIIFFNEPLNLLRILFLILILVGILGLKITSA